MRTSLPQKPFRERTGETQCDQHDDYSEVSILSVHLVSYHVVFSSLTVLPCSVLDLRIISLRQLLPPLMTAIVAAIVGAASAGTLANLADVGVRPAAMCTGGHGALGTAYLPISGCLNLHHYSLQPTFSRRQTLPAFSR